MRGIGARKDTGPKGSSSSVNGEDRESHQVEMNEKYRRRAEKWNYHRLSYIMTNDSLGRC
jgi:hypothetical protein